MLEKYIAFNKRSDPQEGTGLQVPYFLRLWLRLELIGEKKEIFIVNFKDIQYYILITFIENLKTTGPSFRVYKPG